MLNTSLEIARGLAALWVFIYHVRLGIPPGPVRQFAEGGFLGVPLFFVISGYCMMASGSRLLSKQRPAGAFLKRRLRRIFPPFWFSIVVAVTIPFVTAVLQSCRGGALRWPTPRWYAFSPLDWGSLVTLTKGLFWTGAAHKPWAPVNPVYWSLAIEVQFYLVMAVALLFRRWYYPILALVTLGSLAFWWLVGPIAPGLFPEYWPMFALGLLLYFVLDRGFHPSRLFGGWTVTASLLIFAGVLAFALGLTMYDPSQSLERQSLFAVFCGVLLWTCSGFEGAVSKEALATRGLVLTGKMSYSIYLVHIQLVSLVTMLVWPMRLSAPMLALTIQILGTLPLAYVFYHFCEKRYATAPARAPRKPLPEPEPVSELVAG